MKKSQKEMMKDAFTKTVAERYEEATPAESRVYWIFIGIVCSLIAAIYLTGLFSALFG